MIKIPTPQEIDYYENGLFEQIMTKVANSISNRIFTIKPEHNWSKFEDKVNTVLKDSGWKLTTQWSGTKDDGYDTWVISPCN